MSAVPSSTTSSTTTTVANRAPQIREVAQARAELGETLTDAIVAFDPDGDPVEVRVSDAPQGFRATVNSRGTVTGFEWQPDEPGEWEVIVIATDPEGAVGVQTVELVARAPRPTPVVLAMGDSIAAGFGRDRSDFLGRDDCFRSEDDAYAVHATDRLVAAGALSGDAEVLLVACAGATIESLEESSVRATDASGSTLPESASQVEWARRLNPTIITLTIGGDDAGLFDTGSYFSESDTTEPQDASLEERLSLARDAIAQQLAPVLAELLRTTDAHIAITTYYDPTAREPVGVDGCADGCFRDAMERVYRLVNREIVEAASAVSETRISVVRLDGEADVWEAPNGAGPDFLREGLGPLQGIVDGITGGSSATCADRGDPPRDLISALDCVHPNSEGHEEIARRVADTLLAI